MKELPKISDAEWSIMKVLWGKSPASFSEIIEGLEDNNDWSPKTVHTLVSRLVKKEAIRVIKNKKCYEYEANVAEGEMKKLETKSFLNKIYNGSVNLFVSNFLKEEKFTEEEIVELKKILDENLK